MNIYENVMELCRITGVSHTNVEKDLWNHSGVIVKWQNSSPRFDKICDLAGYFGVSLDYFATGKLEASMIDLSRAENIQSAQELELVVVTDWLNEHNYHLNHKDNVFIIDDEEQTITIKETDFLEECTKVCNLLRCGNDAILGEWIIGLFRKPLKEDTRLLNFYHASDTDGKTVIMACAIEESRRTEKEKTQTAVESAG